MCSASRRSDVLSILLELFSQMLVDKEDAALDSSDRQIQFLGNLIVFVTGHNPVEGFAVIIREGVQGNGNFFDGIGAFGGCQT